MYPSCPDDELREEEATSSSAGSIKKRRISISQSPPQSSDFILKIRFVYFSYLWEHEEEGGLVLG